MGMNAWFRDHPAFIVLAGVIVAGAGVVRGQGVALVVGIGVAIVGVARFVLG